MAIGINGLGRIGRLVLKDYFGGFNRKSNSKDINIFHQGVFEEVDKIEIQMNHIEHFFKKLCTILSLYIEHEIEKTSKSKGKS